MPIVLPLVALDVLVIVLWTIAVALAIALLMDKLASILHAVPIAGGFLSSKVKDMAQAITNAAGALETGLDKLAGAAWHQLSRYMDKWWQQFVSQAAIVAHIAQIVGHLVYTHSGLSSLVHRLEKVFHGIEHGVKTLTREFHGIDRRVTKLEHELARGIGADVLPRIRTLERDLGHVEHKVIPAIEGAETALQNDITALGEYIRANFLSSATDAITAAVVVALGALGLGGLRCSNFRGLLNRFGCGLGTLLNDLLGIMIAGLALESVCEFLPLLEDAFGAVVGPMVNLLNDVPLGACEQVPGTWSQLNVHTGPLPPAQTLGPFGS